MAFKVVMSPTRPGYPFEIEREILSPIGAEVVVVHWENEAQYVAQAADADAVVQGRGVVLTAGLIAQLRKAKAVMNGAVGLDRIDIDAATAHGIAVINVPDVWVNEVADHAMMLLLAVARKLKYAAGMAHSGKWAQVHSALAPVPRLQGKTLGLVSFGTIARNVAKRAQAFGINVIAHDPFVTEEQMAALGVGARTLEQLLAEADFVSAHAPHTRGTHHMLGAAQFALMKPTAIFVNTGRGKVVDEPALIQALQNGTIAAAGLDVLEEEPPAADNPLLSMDNVLVTPHTAFYSDEAFIASRVRVGEEIRAVLSGQRPRTCANPSVLDGLGLK
ncbi:MAG: C-terminal binding protein [Chloroflexi bacterium]|nr:C-terminal binding protein [Chloroflexota bacterium]